MSILCVCVYSVYTTATGVLYIHIIYIYIYPCNIQALPIYTPTWAKGREASPPVEPTEPHTQLYNYFYMYSPAAALFPCT